MDKIEEYNLWIRFKSGDNQALSVLYKLYANQLYSYGIKISREESLVKDCIQEVFINLADKRNRLIISDKTHLYLFKSLRNKIIEEYRSNSRKRNIEKNMVHDLDNQILSAEERIVVSEDEHFQKKIIFDAIKSLSEHQQEAIFLKFSEGLNYEDIAIILDVEIASVRTLMYRTLKELKENISRKGIFLLSIIHILKSR